MSREYSLRERLTSAPAIRWSAAIVGKLVLLAAAAGLVLALLGPFGGYLSMTLGERLRFWETLLLLASGFHIAAIWLSLRGTAYFQVPEVLALIPASLLAAIPTALIIPGLNLLIFGTIGVAAPGMLIGYVLTISVPMQMLSLVLLRREAALRAGAAPRIKMAESVGPVAAGLAVDDPTAAPAPSRAEPSLFQRLPARLGRELQCLEMQDHYVKIHTRLGSVMLLMRMSDAEEETAGIEGSRVHRSWWVAHQAVTKVERMEGRTLLRLQNGLQVPVSRERWAALRSLPWIEERLK